MAQVVCFGEALIDFLNTGRTTEDGLRINQFSQYPGGAPANVAVAIAKLGGEAAFAGQLGDDLFGDFLLQSLKSYDVDTSLVERHPSAPTALAFVFLDESNDRQFKFLRQHTADLVFRPEQVSHAWFASASMLHFCSNTLTDHSISDATRQVLSTARQCDAVISFDANLRHNLWESGEANATRVNGFAKSTDILKLSREELTFLADGDETGYLSMLFENGVQLIVMTDGANAIHALRPGSETVIEPPSVQAVDTTGGGDAFMGGLLFGLSRSDHVLARVRSDVELTKVLEFAARCGALAVSRPGAFPAFPSAAEMFT
ncbi:MAG: carbohydrate kinase [Pseudomonadota bacterium]